MALIDEDQLQDLAEAIIPVLENPTPCQAECRELAVAKTKAFCEKIMQYIIDNIEIKGVTVATGTLLVPPPAVTPGDGGATLYGTTLTAQVNAQTLSQNNDGKGLAE